jgi:hypothetical protein
MLNTYSYFNAYSYLSGKDAASRMIELLCGMGALSSESQQSAEIRPYRALISPSVPTLPNMRARSAMDGGPSETSIGNAERSPTQKLQAHPTFYQKMIAGAAST